MAAIERTPARVTGDGRHTVRQLAEKANRKLREQTGGEARIPLDEETRRVVRQAGFDWDAVPPAGKTVPLRKTANFHTGGTIRDVTDQVPPRLRRIAEEAKPHSGHSRRRLRFHRTRLHRERYVIIEAMNVPDWPAMNLSHGGTVHRLSLSGDQGRGEGAGRLTKGCTRIETIVKKATIPARCIGRKPPCTTGPIPLISQAVLKVHSHMRRAFMISVMKPRNRRQRVNSAGALFGRAHLAVLEPEGLLAPVPPFLEGRFLRATGAGICLPLVPPADRSVLAYLCPRITVRKPGLGKQVQS